MARATLPVGPAPRLSLWYAAFFMMNGIYVPFFPVWLAAEGLSPAQIGIVTAAPYAARIVATPILSALADGGPSLRRALLIYSWLAAASFAGLILADGFWAILVVSLVSTVFWSAVTPLGDALAVGYARRGALEYGRVRVWGSVGYVAANLAGGALFGRIAPGHIALVLLASLIIAAAMAHILPRAGAERSGARIPLIASLATTVRRPALTLGFLIGGLIAASHAVFYSFGAISWQAAGISEGRIGVLWAVGTGAEIVLFFTCASIIRRLGPVRVLALAAGLAVLRWTLTALSPPFAALILLQGLHAASYGLNHLAMMEIIRARVAERRTGSAQGLLSTIGGIAMAAATVAAGPLYRALGAGAFLPMAGIAALALALIPLLAVLMRRPPRPLPADQPQSAGAGGNTRLPS